MDKLIIDRDTLKAIVVDTRLNILKLLHNRNYMLSELSNILNLSPSTIKEHLDILCKVDLIKKNNDHRKWKYYSITFKGRNLINPNETKAMFSFVLSFILTIGIGLFFINSLLVSSSFSSTEALSIDSSTSVLNINQSQDFDKIPLSIDESNKMMSTEISVSNSLDQQDGSYIEDNLNNKISQPDRKTNKNMIIQSLFITFGVLTILTLINYFYQKRKVKFLN
jgi:DNA-binding MarR family transcriptional regulator